MIQATSIGEDADENQPEEPAHYLRGFELEAVEVVRMQQRMHHYEDEVRRRLRIDVRAHRPGPDALAKELLPHPGRDPPPKLLQSRVAGGSKPLEIVEEPQAHLSHPGTAVPKQPASAIGKGKVRDGEQFIKTGRDLGCLGGDEPIDDLFFAAEVLIDRFLAHPQLAGEIAHGKAGKAEPEKMRPRDLQDPFAVVHRRTRFHGRSSTLCFGTHTKKTNMVSLVSKSNSNFLAESLGGRFARVGSRFPRRRPETQVDTLPTLSIQEFLLQTRSAPMPSANDIRKGNVIKYNNEPHFVMEMQHRTPGNLRAFVQAKLRNLRSGRSGEVRFNSTETVEVMQTDRQTLEFSYVDRGVYFFLHPETFEQYEFSEEFVASSKNYLVPNGMVDVLFIEGVPIEISLPSSVALKVVESADGLRGDTASNVQKPAKLETGLTVQVPLFIKEGETIKVSTADGSYLGRA